MKINIGTPLHCLLHYSSCLGFDDWVTNVVFLISEVNFSDPLNQKLDDAPSSFAVSVSQTDGVSKSEIQKGFQERCAKLSRMKIWSTSVKSVKANIAKGHPWSNTGFTFMMASHMIVSYAVKNSAEAQNWKHTKTLFTRDYLLTVTSVVRFSKPARDFYHTRPARRKLASSAILSRAITTSLWNTWPRTTLFIRTMHFRVRFVDTGLARESYWKLTLRWFMRSSACPVICVNSSRRTRVQ